MASIFGGLAAFPVVLSILIRSIDIMPDPESFSPPMWMYAVFTVGTMCCNLDMMVQLCTWDTHNLCTHYFSAVDYSNTRLGGVVALTLRLCR